MEATVCTNAGPIDHPNIQSLEVAREIDCFAADPGGPEIIGASPTLRLILRDVKTVAATDAAVLILGETGTGKELIARAIHNLSARRRHALVRADCASIPSGLDRKSVV